MEKNLILLIVIFSFLACNDNPKKEFLEKEKKLQPTADTKELTSDFMTWWTYYYNEISLSSDFEALDEDSKKISKEQFLMRLTSGGVIPVEMKTDSVKTYKLYLLPANVDQDISSTIKNVSAGFYKFYKMEGQKFPEFDLTDLKGKHYNNESLKGKTTILKTWFIACKPCIKEMPELNDLVDKNNKNSQVQFLSLALDEAKPLEEFLSKTEFKYPVAAEQKNLITNKLGLTEYPTHLVIDENGKIKKVFQKASQIRKYLENNNLNQSSNLDSELPPPPPAPTKNPSQNDA